MTRSKQDLCYKYKQPSLKCDVQLNCTVYIFHDVIHSFLSVFMFSNINERGGKVLIQWRCPDSINKSRRANGNDIFRHANCSYTLAVPLPFQHPRLSVNLRVKEKVRTITPGQLCPFQPPRSPSVELSSPLHVAVRKNVKVLFVFSVFPMFNYR